MDDCVSTLSNQPTLPHNSCQPRALGNCIGGRTIVWLRRCRLLYDNNGIHEIHFSEPDLP